MLCLLGFAVLNASLLWRVHDSIFQGYGDFASFYTAGQIVRSGQSRRLYDPSLQWKVQQQFASTVKIRRGPLPYIRPPFEALLFLPLAYLTYPAACLVWMALKVGLLLMIPLVLPASDGKSWTISAVAVKSLVCLAFFPVGFDLLQGQDSVLLLLILVLGLRLLVRGADLGCGAVLALAMFKFHLTIPLLLVFVLRKKGKVVLGFLSTASLLLAISLIMVRWSGLLAYPKYLWQLNQSPGLGMIKQQSMPNLRGLMTILLGQGPLSAAAHWFLGGIVVFGIILASRSWRGDDRNSIPLGFCFTIVVILTTSYYANASDLTLLLLPLLLLGPDFLQGAEISGWPRTLFLVAAGVLLCTPLWWVVALRLDEFFWIAPAVIALAVSISASERSWRPA